MMQSRQLAQLMETGLTFDQALAAQHAHEEADRGVAVLAQQEGGSHALAA